MPRKERQLRIRSVLRDEPDIEKLTLAIIRMAQFEVMDALSLTKPQKEEQTIPQAPLRAKPLEKKMREQHMRGPEAFERERGPVFAELRQTIGDMARGEEPRTITHAFLAHPGEALILEDLVGMTGLDPLDVERMIVMYEVMGWVVHYTEGGFEHYIFRPPQYDASEARF